MNYPIVYNSKSRGKQLNNIYFKKICYWLEEKSRYICTEVERHPRNTTKKKKSRKIYKN